MKNIFKYLSFSFMGIISFKIAFNYDKKLMCLPGRDKNALYKEKTHIPSYFENVDKINLMKIYPNLKLLNSKAIDMLIGILRDKNLTTEQFRIISRRILNILIEEALAQECDVEIIKESPLGYYKTIHNPRDMTNYLAISILRSGNAMVDDLLRIIPDIKVGNILVQRNDDSVEKEPIFYFEKLPLNIQENRILLLVPLLASGGSASMCIKSLLNKGVREENIIFINLISCEEGIKNLFAKFPKIKIISANCDPILLPIKYIAPGLGDFGDRYYGTQH